MLAHVVVVNCLLDEPTRANEFVDGCCGCVGLSEERFAVDLAQHPTVALDERVWPDHLQVEHDPARHSCVDHIPQAVHDVLGLHSSE